VTLIDDEKEQQKQRELEMRKKFEAEERKRQSARVIIKWEYFNSLP